MRKILSLLFVLAATVARAEVTLIKLPCDPVLLVGPEGRLIPNANVSITNLDGSQIVGGVWSNYGKTIAFDGRIPASEILQVFIDPGVYNVSLSGAGLTKTYIIRCGGGFGEGVRTISIDRTADVILINTSSPPFLACVTGNPCRLEFGADDTEFAMIDFILPSYPVILTSVLFSWSGSPPGHTGERARWTLNWCKYVVGEPPCDPTGSIHPFSVLSTMTTSFARVDVLINTIVWDTALWAPDDHIVMSIAREGDAGDDTLLGFGMLENIRLEFTK